jgi:hypothetical protein
MHGRRHHPTDTQQGNKQSGGCLTWRLAAVLTFGLALTSPSPGQAKTFHCGAGDVQCLIEAIQEANTNGQKNTLRLAAGTYTLTTVNNSNNIDGPNGLPSITGKIIVQGAGAEATHLERQFTPGLNPCSFFSSPLPPFRILQVAPTGVLTLVGLTLQGGCLFDTFLSGAGIGSQGTLTVVDSTITSNSDLTGLGGGIDSRGALIVTHSRIAGNDADYTSGIFAAGDTIIEHSSIVENGTGTLGVAQIGGISNAGTMYITNSTIARNDGDSVGGINNEESGTLTILNSTIAENESVLESGGINNDGDMLKIINSTITKNISSAPNSFFGRISAGIGNISFFADIVGTVTVLNTIVAQNTFANPPPSGSGGPDCGGPITSLGTNLIGDPTGCDISLQPGDLTGDPGLDDLTDNGMPGNGHVPLLPGSPAIDAGNDAGCPRRDQLGQRRVDIPDVGSSRCDIGAVEFQHQDKHQDNADNNQPDADPATTAQATP